MPVVTFTDVTSVHVSEIGGDEVYLEVDGNIIWSSSGSMNQGDTQSINKDKYYDEKNPITIRLWEDDKGSNDILGEKTLPGSASDSSPFDMNKQFFGDYDLFYYIT